MGLFGWSLPPGVTSLPGEDSECRCDVCHGDPEEQDTTKFGACICRECPHCGTYGDPRCYELLPGGCGMTLTPEQIAQKTYFEVLWREIGKLQSECDWIEWP